jgi:iron complex outermembrane receptor protein
VNLKDVLQFTSGVYVQPRFGAADESQISVRGSGLRNNFHARGINLLVNGMPYRNADGFTDFESLELMNAESIEVYKGANALRFGGSTMGGAINISTSTGYSASPLSFTGQAGAFGFGKGQLSSGNALGPFDYYASAGHTELGGYRAWSDNSRNRVNLHAGFKISPKLDVRAFYFFAHVDEHLPGSVDKATLVSAPRSAFTENVGNRWGRIYDLHHIGLQLRTQLTPTQRVEISPYLQYRDIDHPIFEVINQLSHDVGTEVRYENTGALGSRNNRLTIGIQPAYETMHNRQFVNVKGEHGALTRDEQDIASNFAVYLENSFSLSDRLVATLGGRFERATRRVEDFFLSNGSQSAERTFTTLSPRLGVLYSNPNGPAVFANVSRTVEPPLFLELTSFGTTGGFVDLDAQDAWQYEIGARSTRFGLTWDISLYDVEIGNEILNLNVQPFAGAPFTVPTYRNSPKTRHSGVEAGAAVQLPGGVFLTGDIRDHLIFRAAYTFGHFVYVDDPAFAGKNIPGAPRHYLTTELKYTNPHGLSFAPMLEWVPGKYFVNSANTDTNTGWSSIGFRAEWLVERLGLSAFVSGQNLANKVFSQSVQVDNVARRYFEPADARAFYAGLRLSR